ncbi:Tetratricopeptide repeat-domain-containing protein, partial [Pavlovales sp. CCMP2436]
MGACQTRTQKEATARQEEAGARLAAEWVAMANAQFAQQGKVNAQLAADLLVAANARLVANPPKHSIIGIRLAAFRELLAKAALAQPRKGPKRWDGTRRAAGEPLTTADVVLELVKQHTLARKCAYVDALPAEAKAPAMVYVSHAWKYIFSEVVSALEQAVGEDEGVWFCALINNQHETGSMTYEFLEGEFRRNIESIARVVLVFTPWSAPVSLTRVWCLFEIFVCVERGIPLEVAMPAAQAKDFRLKLILEFDSIDSALSKIALDEAEATKPEDKANILRAVGNSVGVGELNMQVLRELRACLVRAGGNALAAEPDHWGLTIGFGRLLQAQGRLDEAEPLFRRALEGPEKTLGPNHPSTLTCVSNLAKLLLAQGKLGEAEPLFRRAL